MLLDREPAFVGREALRREAEPVGIVTSGSHSPTLGHAIAMAYVPPQAAATGTMLEIGIRDARVAASVVDLPFYRRARR